MAAPLLSALLLALSLGVLPLPWWLRAAALVLLVALVLVVAHRWHWPRRACMALLLALLLCCGWGLQGQPRPGPRDPVRLLPSGDGSALVLLRGLLLSDPQPQAAGCRALLQVGGSRTELRFSACPPLQQGWRIAVQGRLARPRPAPHPLLSGPAERLARQGAWSQLRVQSWQLLTRPATPIADLRRRIATSLLRSGGPEAGGVLAALVLGSAVVPVPAAVREAFRAAGLSHALAASGFHLSVLLGVVMALGRRGPPLLRLSLAGGAMGLFLLLAGPQPSVVRAVAMAALALLVRESGRQVKPLGVLLLSVSLMLLPAPAWLLDVGFQLSVAATAGLLFSAGPLQRGLAHHLPAWGATALAVPLAASLWTLPLQVLHFGALPLYAVPANVLAAPLLTPLTLGAMALAVCALILPALVGPLSWLLLPITRLFIALASWVAALPMAQWPLGKVAALLVLLLALGLLPWLLSLRWAGARRWGAAAFGLALLLHLLPMRADRLLLVQEGPRDWLLARHGGRAALVSRRSDGFSCSRARDLAMALGIHRYDWVLLLDALPSDQPDCWRLLTPSLLASGDGSPPLQPGQRLASDGLAIAPIAHDSQALRLQVGRRRWALLPDRQAWWRWRQQPEAVDGFWLGFAPSATERRQLPAEGGARLWLPAAGSGSGWHLA